MDLDKLADEIVRRVLAQLKAAGVPIDATARHLLASQAVAEEAKARVTKYRAQGRKAKYVDVLNEVKKERGLPVVAE